MFSNIRVNGTPVDDLETGNDLMIFSQLENPRAWHIQPLNRGRVIPHPQTGEMLRLSKYPISGGFVPVDALLEDGSPHPYAGTGFGVSVVIGFPSDYSVQWVGKMADPFQFLEVMQFQYDGKTFRVTACDETRGDRLLDGWELTEGSLGMAIPDGEDFLYGMTGGKAGQTEGTGMSRWKRQNGKWGVVDFEPVTGNDGSMESSLIRDYDGSVLFTARGCQSWRLPPGAENNTESIRIWRRDTSDNSWKLLFREADARPPTPVTLNQGPDGPYIACNALRWTGALAVPQHGQAREYLEYRPLSEDRRGLLPAKSLKSGPDDFGPAPTRWCIDHPMGAEVTLQDGRPRHLVAYRAMDLAESSGAMPTDSSGIYLEQF